MFCFECSHKKSPSNEGMISGEGPWSRMGLTPHQFFYFKTGEDLMQRPKSAGLTSTFPSASDAFRDGRRDHHHQMKRLRIQRSLQCLRCELKL